MARASTSTPGSRREKRVASRPSDRLQPDDLLAMYRWMLLTRRLEERLTNLYRQNQVVGGLYRSLGQEGETVASVCALESRDVVGPLIRNLGALLVKGYRPRDIAMQYMARAGGPTGGKDLNVHFGDVRTMRVVPPISMLGDVIPVMCGVALAARMRGEDVVALTFIGDGGSSTGAFYEGMNLAAVWKLPVIVIGENNRYAYSTPTHRQMAVPQMADKATGLGIHGETVDGNDVLAVYDAVRAARDRAARGEGPSLIEVMTYRRKGHAEHDMQKYVPEGEVERWARENDPLDRFHDHLVKAGIADGAALDALDAGVREELETEIEAAQASPLPDPRVAEEAVYADPPRAADHLAPYRDGAA